MSLSAGAVSSHKLLAVEGVRGVACFLVLLSHLSLIFFPYLHNFNAADASAHPWQDGLHHSPGMFIFSGTSAVYIFFVLSGYILSVVAHRSSQPLARIKAMVIKRYPRLMLPALASCLLVYLVFSFIHVSRSSLSYWIQPYGQFDFSLLNAIYSGSIDIFFVSGASLYNPVLWTMQVELLGSFVIYALCANHFTLKLPYLAELTWICVFILVLSKVLGVDLGLGISAFYGGYFFKNWGRAISTHLALCLLLLGVYLGGAHNGSHAYLWIYQWLDDYTYQVCNFLSGFCIVYAILFNERMNRLFSLPWVVWMGTLSFSVYLIHMPILATVGVWLFNSAVGFGWSFNVAALLACGLSIVAVYLSAIIFYRYVDAKGMQCSDWLAQVLLRKK